MATTTRRTPILHTQTGDITTQDVIGIIDDVIGKPETLEGIRLEARKATEKYCIAHLKMFESQVLRDAEEERTTMRDRLTGFYDGYVYAKTGKMEL